MSMMLLVVLVESGNEMTESVHVIKQDFVAQDKDEKISNSVKDGQFVSESSCRVRVAIRH